MRQLSQHISKKISDRLSSLYATEREKFEKGWPDIEMIIKLGILQDDKFYERSKDFLVWKNFNGEWTTIADYLERHGDYKGKVFYGTEDQLQSHILDLYKQKGIEILAASSLIDTPLINLLEDKMEGVKFSRIGAVDDTIVDPTREKTLLDADGRTESFKIAEFIRSRLENDQLTVEAKSLNTDTVPALLVIDEEMRRMRETMALAHQPLPQTLPPNGPLSSTPTTNLSNRSIDSKTKIPIWLKR